MVAAYTLFLVGQTTGEYHVSVKLGATPMDNSPFLVRVVPGAHDPSKSVGEGGALSGGVVGELNTFTLICKDTYGNNLIATPIDAPVIVIKSSGRRRRAQELLGLTKLEKQRRLATTATVHQPEVARATLGCGIQQRVAAEWELGIGRKQRR